MKYTAVYPGTFDPITLGHVDIIQRGAQLFEQVIVAVAKSTRKQPLLNWEDRQASCQQALIHLPNVKVKPLTGILINFIQEQQAHVILRGLRTAADFDNEMQMACMNNIMASEIETIYLNADSQLACISSTQVRDIVLCGGDIAKFVPKAVLPFIQSPN